MRRIVLVTLSLCAGCAVIEPGHRGLLFTRSEGLRHEVLNPGYHRVGPFRRIDDFDVTYSTRHEDIHTISSEGLALDLKVAIIFRPIVSELYDLDVEIGSNYYDEVVGPEFRTATRGVFARHSYQEVQKLNERVEDEVEAEVRRRIAGKHIEISSVTLEEVNYAPEILSADRAKLVGEREALRRQAALEADRQREKLQTEAEIRKKEKERKLAEEQAAIERVQAETDAETRLTRAKAEAESIHILAKAHAEEKRAESTTLTPLMVMMHAYDALAKLGGSGANIMLGDWSHVPNFLFPATLRAPQLVTHGSPPPSADASMP
jgi:regulator of protease activity HflC (stomatin/prohibitin superfamily)